jgi:hypothetical protein
MLPAPIASMIADYRDIIKPQRGLLEAFAGDVNFRRKISDFAQDRDSFPDSLVKVGCEHQF